MTGGRRSAHMGSMELTLVKEERDRSLEHRCDITGADPIPASMLRDVSFVPADLLIWWQLSDSDPDEEHTLHAYAWPAQRETSTFADWRDQAKMPSWIRQRSETVHRDLLTNTDSHSTGIKARWAHGLMRRWKIEGADALKPDRYNKDSFVPVELRIWWSLNVSLPTSENRYTIYAHSAGVNGRRSPEKTSNWGSSRSSFEHGFEELPHWIRELADAQYVELEAIAKAAAIERESGV